MYANMGDNIVDITAMARCCKLLHDAHGRARPANTHDMPISSGRGGSGGRRQHYQSSKRKKGRRR
jgi:3-deoxy-D-manno-octulosonate 8-phosphate phosphatase KdsC-like HAD superfamily phosphatase